MVRHRVAETQTQVVRQGVLACLAVSGTVGSGLGVSFASPGVMLICDPLGGMNDALLGVGAVQEIVCGRRWRALRGQSPEGHEWTGWSCCAEQLVSATGRILRAVQDYAAASRMKSDRSLWKGEGQKASCAASAGSGL